MSAHENEKEETLAPAPDAGAEEEDKAAGEPALPDMESRTEPALPPSDTERGQSEAEAAGNISGDAWPTGGLDLVLKFLPQPEGLPPGQREVWVGVRPAQASLAATLFRLFRLEELEPLPEKLVALIRECTTKAAASEVKPEGAGEKPVSPQPEEVTSPKNNQAGTAVPRQTVNSEGGAARPQQVVPRKDAPDSQAARQLTLF